MEGWKKVRVSKDKTIYDRKWDGSRLTVIQAFGKCSVIFNVYENGMPKFGEKILLSDATQKEAVKFANQWMKKHKR